MRQALEDAIIAELATKLGRVGNPQTGYLQEVAPYNGQITDSAGPDDLRRALRGQAPAVLVVAADARLTAESVTRRRYARRITVELYAISTHMRTRENRVRSDVVADSDSTADPGLYRIAEDVQQILSGNDLGLDGVSPFIPLREEILLQLPDFTCWRLTYAVETDAHVRPHGWGDVPLESYEIDANLDADTDPPNPLVEADENLTA